MRFTCSKPKSISIYYHTFSLSLCEKISHHSQFNQILSHAIVSGNFADPFVSSKILLSSLSQFHDVAFSRTLFSQIKNPNLFSWNFMFRAYSQSSCDGECVGLYDLMRSNGVLPDNYTFPLVFKACGRLLGLKKGLEVHCLSLKLGFEFDVFVQNSLISMYFMCGVVELACKVFDFVPVLIRDVVSWNSMISGFVQNDRSGDALKVFDKMLGDGFVRFDEVTLVGAFTACGRMRLLDLGRKIHGLVVGNGLVLNVFLGSSLIDMYMKCGKIEDARKVFDRIPYRNVVCWTTMIVGCVQLDMFKEAIELFGEMQLAGIKGDAATTACVISACGHSGALDQGRLVHTYCKQNGIEINISVKNALIDLYSKCGDIEKALALFREHSTKDVFSWTAMISGLAIHGESEKALQLFSHMEGSSDVRPNEVTFLGVLSACAHRGLVGKGFHYFKAMTQTYKLLPRIEHYGCMVDLLGRANLLVEAEKFIRIMPIQPDVVLWRSMLFACRTHGNIELAELAADKIKELEPRSEMGVLLSNAYASSFRWNDATRVRKIMHRQGIQKQAGCSFVEINGHIHEFLVADGSHFQVDLIHDTICGINRVLNSEGFEFNASLLNFQL